MTTSPTNPASVVITLQNTETNEMRPIICPPETTLEKLRETIQAQVVVVAQMARSEPLRTSSISSTQEPNLKISEIVHLGLAEDNIFYYTPRRRL